MSRREIEGAWVKGWPDRKRPTLVEGKDAQGRVIAGKTPLLELEGLITPTDLSYIVAQLEMPDPISPEDWSLTVEGEVERPFTLNLEDLQRLPGRTVRAVTECAGNDSEFFDFAQKGGTKPSRSNLGDARLSSAASTIGYVSAGEFTGVSLASVLEKATPKNCAKSVRLEGFDRGRPDPAVQYLAAGRTDFDVKDPGIINYDKGLPMEKALHPDTILAWAQNGEYLQHVHGAPVRLIVPGWSGNWWVKWIQKIEVLSYIPSCYYQTEYFVYSASPTDPNRTMVTSLGVKSIVTSPRDEDSPLLRSSHAIRGLAWSGCGAIVRVEVSVDGGETWHEAHLEDPHEKWLWARWSYLWTAATPGQYRIMARATDEIGRTQPQTKWNFQRKHFDGIVPVDVSIQ